MSRKKAIVLGIFTILPFFYIILFCFFFIGSFMTITGRTANNEDTYTMFMIILPIHFSIMIEIIVLLVIYIKDVFRNKNIEETKRTLWTIVLFFGNMIAMPIYWYINIWKPLRKNKIENNS